MYRYSLIIPHRNTPDLLLRLLDSIPNRNDLEIIVIDDNSDADKRPLIERDNVEVVLINAENARGAGRARNYGLERAKGTWLLFADADDYYDSDNLNSLLDKYSNDENTDIVYLNADVFNEKGVVVMHSINKRINEYLDNKYYSEMFLRYSVWTPWTRMVRHDMVKEHQLRFEEVPAANDKNFSLECSRYAKTIAVETSVIYHYFRPGYDSQTDKKRNSKSLDAMIMVRSHTNRIYSAVGYKYKLSYYAFFHNSKYSRDLSPYERLRKYLSTLRKNKVCLVVDIYRYFLRKQLLKIIS